MSRGSRQDGNEELSFESMTRRSMLKSYCGDFSWKGQGGINYIPATLLSLENEENVIEGIVLAAMFFHVRQYRRTMIASGGKFSQVDRPYIGILQWRQSCRCRWGL